MSSENFSRWITTGAIGFPGIGILAAISLRAGFGLPFARVVVPITVLVTIQLAFFIMMYWTRQRYRQTGDLRAAIVVVGMFGLLLGLSGMYYAAQLGLVSPQTVKDNYFGFSISMVVVIVIVFGLFSYWKPTQFRQ